MQHADNSYCKVCGLVVAPFDPERIQRGLDVFHRPCWKKVPNEAQVLNARVAVIRTHWGLRPVPRLH